MRRMIAMVVLSVAAMAARSEPVPLPLELAFSRRSVPRTQRAVLSRDGRLVAYEIQTPPVLTPETSGRVEPRFLPSGLPASYAGTSLWISDTRDGTNRRVCPEDVNCWRGSFSPDSRKLAFYSDAGGEVGLWIYDMNSGQPRRVGTSVIKAKLWPGDEAAWSNDGSTLFVPLRPPTTPAKSEQATATLGDKPRVTVHRTEAAARGGGDQPTAPSTMNDFYIAESNSTLAAVDVESGNARIVVPFDAQPRPNHLRLSPDGRWLSYLSVYQKKNPSDADNHQDLVIVPSDGGAPVVIFRDIRMNESDYAGSTYRWTEDSRSVVFSKNRDLWIADIGAGGTGASEPRQLASAVGRIAETPLLLTAAGDAVLVSAQPADPKAEPSLVIVPLDGSSPRILGVRGVPVRSDHGRLWQPVAEKFFVIRDVTGAPQREIVEVDIASGATRRIWVGQGRFDVVGATAERVVSLFEGLTTPPDLFLLDRRFEIVRRLSDTEPRLRGLPVGAMESFESAIPLHDGTIRMVRTHIFLPPGAKKGEALPTLIYFYSGSAFGRNAQDFGGGAPNSIPVQVFTSRGYAVLFCDVPMTPTGKTPANPAREIADALLAQAYRSADLGFSDIRRMALIGHSYGGYSAAAVITRTNLFRAGIAMDGLYDLPSYYARMTSAGTASFSWAETGQGRMGTHPWADLQRYIDNSPYHQADRIRTPLLLIHGEKDSVCPVDEAEKMFNAVKRLGGNAELAVYEGEGHVPGKWALVHAVDATRRMLDFLGTHLKKEP